QNNNTIFPTKMKKIAINTDKPMQAYEAVTNEQQQLLADTYGEAVFKPRDITERIKTFDDAFRALGLEHPLVREFTNKAFNSSPDLEAYLSLRIICAALNEGWEADYSNNEQEKWYPWFYNGGGGLVYANANNAGLYSVTNGGVRLAFKTRELAKYAGRQFIEIYKDLLL
ncbi:MAG: hypothetical protein ACI30W_03220, partial [Muribaculaceae bacterium]